ncbi:hypothetical protein [Microlunatus soli]|uniref:Uncharacterized protein n=1 Tax=Microlunatus soli TaxID=630515 RepID=A0A1H1THH1_9ACTN|nr:hypothetical protein [Microlunatus soli]SDS59757.1 hypothetical protein SAMN04489812_2399 [Microlunatus soli]
MSQGSFGRMPAAVIPYVEPYDGDRRVLRLNLTTGNRMLQKGQIPPVVAIDGRQYIVYWGTVSFEIPADRACHLSVHVDSERIAQVASTLLPPGDLPVELTYATNFISGVGTLH